MRNRSPKITLHEYEVRKPQTRMTTPRAAIDSEAAMDVGQRPRARFERGILFHWRGDTKALLFSAPCRKPTHHVLVTSVQSSQRDRSHAGLVTVIRHFMFPITFSHKRSRSSHISSHDITADHISWQRLDRVGLGSHYKLNPDDMKPSARTPGINSCLTPFHHIYRPFKVVDI
jgi:hypothetical protein